MSLAVCNSDLAAASGADWKPILRRRLSYCVLLLIPILSWPYPA